MVARLRRNQYVIARAAVLALAVGAFVVLSGAPAHAQVYYNPYSYPYTSPYYGSPYYSNPGAACQTFSFGALSYSNCPAQPYNYYTSPYSPYTYLYYGPSLPHSRSAGSRER
jgi:hypothetical protein